MKVRFEVKGKVVEALRICYENNKPYLHGGEFYKIKSLAVVGSGRDSRLIADMEPFI